MKTIILSLMGLISLTACNTYNEDDLNSFDQQIKEYMKQNNLDYERSESGMYFSIVNEGDGEDYIRLTDNVTFTYRGSFITGEVFQIIKEQEALSFQVRELIVGWQEALSLLKNHGKINIIMPPHLGYGSKETGLIKPNSILVYELEVLDVI